MEDPPKIDSTYVYIYYTETTLKVSCGVFDICKIKSKDYVTKN